MGLFRRKGSESFQDLLDEFDKASDDPVKQAELIQRAAKMAQKEPDTSGRKNLMEHEVATRYQGLKERTGYPGR